jgi:hypothetical protein
VSLSIDGDSASAESCAITHAISPGLESDQVSHLFIGRYLDRLERRGGAWRIARRRYLLHGAVSEGYVENPALAIMSKADDLSPTHPYFCGPHAEEEDQ